MIFLMTVTEINVLLVIFWLPKFYYDVWHVKSHLLKANIGGCYNDFDGFIILTASLFWRNKSCSNEWGDQRQKKHRNIKLRNKQMHSNSFII